MSGVVRTCDIFSELLVVNMHHGLKNDLLVQL